MELSKQINDQMQTMSPNALFGFNQKIAQIPGLVKLTLGEPGFATPQQIKQAGIKAILDDQNHYADPRGLQSLRENAAEFLARQYHLHYDPDQQILVTLGASEGIHDICGTILNPGDEVIIPTPIYSMYAPNIELAGGKPVFVDLSNDDFVLTPQRLALVLENHPRAKAVLLNYPNNPIGNTYSAAQLSTLAKVIQQYDVWCISDEIYSELEYESQHVSIASFIPDQTMVLTGVSKAFAMTGWRVGLVCGPTKLIAKLTWYHTIAVTAVPTSDQYAASEAFKSGIKDAEQMRAEYQKRRDLLRKGLAKARFDCPNPGGAFYIFAKIPEQYGQDSMKFAYRLAREAKVGTIPGIAFGPGGEGHLRFSYAASVQDLQIAIKRIQHFVAITTPHSRNMAKVNY